MCARLPVRRAVRPALPLRRVLVEGDGEAETLLVAYIDLELARQKTKEPGEGQYAVRLFADRRPELYGKVADASP